MYNFSSRYAVEQPQVLAQYSVSNAVATYYLYMKYVPSWANSSTPQVSQWLFPQGHQSRNTSLSSVNRKTLSMLILSVGFVTSGTSIGVGKTWKKNLDIYQGKGWSIVEVDKAKKMIVIYNWPTAASWTHFMDMFWGKMLNGIPWRWQAIHALQVLRLPKPNRLYQYH